MEGDTQKESDVRGEKVIGYLRQNHRLVVLAAVGVLLVAVGGFFDLNREKPGTTASEPQSAVAAVQPSSEEALENKLVALLSKVKGAGSVAVQVTLETGETTDLAKNNTKESRTIQEKDPSGTIRTTTEVKNSEQILLAKENNGDKPIVLKKAKPVVKGVLVLAEGAGDSTVKANLTQAVETGLGIAAYKVTVLPQKK